MGQCDVLAHEQGGGDVACGVLVVGDGEWCVIGPCQCLDLQDGDDVYDGGDYDDEGKGDVMGSGDTLKPWGWRPMGRLEHHFCPGIAPKPTGMPDFISFLSFFDGAFSSLSGLS